MRIGKGRADMSADSPCQNLSRERVMSGRAWFARGGCQLSPARLPGRPAGLRTLAPELAAFGPNDTRTSFGVDDNDKELRCEK